MLGNKNSRSFYDTPESDLRMMAAKHYGGVPTESAFSSWAASLHLVLCYAKSMPADHDPHVAMMDIKSLSTQVLAWHCPHLLPIGDHEYLVYRPIRGQGYRAVSFKTLEENGILKLFPE